MANLRIGILGCGGISRRHISALLEHEDAAVVAFCDVAQGSIDARLNDYYADRDDKPTVYHDAAQMYAEADLDGVVICTPHTLHYEQGMQAMDAGAHVLMEKPMVTSAQHAHAIAEKAEQTGKIFCIGYNTPCTPEFHYLRQQIRDRAFGKLELICGWLMQPWRVATVGLWRQDPALSGGGMAYDSGAHLLNSLCWTVESPVVEVHAYTDNVGTPVDINSSMNIRFKNGVKAAIAIGGNCTESGSHLTYAFDNGRVDINGWNGSWINVFKGRQPVKYPPITGEQLLPADNWIDAILGRDEPRTTPQNGIIQSELMDLIYESAKTGQPARVRQN